MTAASGRPVDRILSTFVNQPGAPLLEASAECRDNQTVVTLTQRRFYADPAQTRRRDGTLWQIPVCLKDADGSAPKCHLVTRRKQTLATSRPCTAPTVLNAGARGYYRVAYAPDLLNKLAPEASRLLSAPERLTLVADGWDLVLSLIHI